MKAKKEVIDKAIEYIKEKYDYLLENDNFIKIYRNNRRLNMFYYEEKWYITILKWLGTLFLGIVFFIIFSLFCMCFSQVKYHYEFIDLDKKAMVYIVKMLDQ